MARYLGTHRLGTIDYASGAKKTLDIDRAGVLHELVLRLKYTVTSGSSAMVGPKFQTLARLIRRLEVTINGNDTVVNLPGHMLSMLNWIEAGEQNTGMTDTFVLTGSSTATSYDVHLFVPFFLPRHRRPDDTGLPVDEFRQAVLAITWGDINDLVGTVNNAAVSSVSLSVTGRYHIGSVTDGQGNAVPRPAYAARELVLIEDELTNSMTNYAIEVQPAKQPISVKDLLVVTTEGGVGSNDILNTSTGTIKMAAPPTTFQEAESLTVQAVAKRRFGFSSWPAGVYPITTELFGEAIDTINASALRSDLRLVFDASFQSGSTNLFEVVREGVRRFATIGG